MNAPASPRRLILAWAALIALSALATGLALSGLGTKALAVPILLLAFLKARVILRDYLGLAQAPEIARGFLLVLALFCAALAGLALAAS